MTAAAAAALEPRAERGEVQGERIQRHAATIREAGAGALDLLAEAERPLVRAQMRHAQRGRISDLIACISLPLLAFAAVLCVHSAYGGWPANYGSGFGQAALPEPEPQVMVAARAAVGFLCLWPLVMFLGAALRAGGSVLEERQRHTAIQLVLTPIPAREIAAAKVLPHLAPFMWGIVAAAPLYFWVGSSGIFFFDSREPMVNPMALSPLRPLVALELDGSALDVEARGVGAGLLMLLGDLALVWAAVHWGAAGAVRSRGPVGLALGLIWRLGLAALAAAGLWMLSMVPAVALCDVLRGEGLGNFLLVLVQASALSVLWWLWPVRSSVRRALGAFTAFDSLVDEEYRPPRRLSLTGWRWWETNWRR